ncbi:MAG TPA: heme biosynthesis HemY N-terminal domain-containing protein [Gammaproteobacteria bacterium]|nr:heme biosynthesis HemY N-terminal domain-containing protein [Gammaproteobacteria bacterium]
MRYLVYAMIALLVAVGVALLTLPDPGYVLIGYGDWSLETTLLVLLLVLAGLYLAVRFLAGLRRLPGRFLHWRRLRRERRARAALNRGLIELAEGQWATAEKRLVRHAATSDNALITYLAAARAAQQQGAHDRRDHYLRLAHGSMPEADVAVGLSQAELQMAHGQLEQALATLRHLRQIAPRHAYVLKMLMKLYQRLQDWQSLRDLLPELRRRKVVGEEELKRLNLEIHRALLEGAARRGDLEALREAWGWLPRTLAQDESLLVIQATQLQRHGLVDEAQELLRSAIRRHWSQRLVYLFGQLEGGDVGRRLDEAEAWLRDHDKDPVLLLTLGRLCLANRLWGKARAYLEASAQLAPTVETCQVLGTLLEQLGEADKAMACYRQGMGLAVGVPTLGKRGSDVLGRVAPTLPMAHAAVETEAPSEAWEEKTSGSL